MFPRVLTTREHSAPRARATIFTPHFPGRGITGPPGRPRVMRDALAARTLPVTPSPRHFLSRKESVAIAPKSLRDHDRARYAPASRVPKRGARPTENVGLFGSPMTGINRAYAI